RPEGLQRQPTHDQDPGCEQPGREGRGDGPLNGRLGTQAGRTVDGESPDDDTDPALIRHQRERRPVGGPGSYPGRWARPSGPSPRALATDAGKISRATG